ncbi:MAG: MarR family winged helix-turn-helix transcriptional regulator [Spirochaetota bacterium]
MRIMGVYELVRETYVLLQMAVVRAFDPLGLRVEEYNVLRLLADAGELRMSVVAQRTLSDDSTTTRVVDSLVERGLAHRRRADDDRRVRLVEITASGRRILGHAERARERAVAAALAPLEERTIERMTGSLEAARDALQNTLRRGGRDG